MSFSELITRQLGANPEGVSRFRLGRGVLGNTTYAFWASMAGIVGVSVAWRENPGMALIVDGGIGIIFLIYLAGTYIFAHKHPETAMLGDLEWLQWHQSQLGAKNKSIIIDQTPIVGSGKIIARDHGGSNDA